ncbi:MAG: germination protein, Ger(x)C family [Firmicutes bacterium]|nr:germination protein, Ger(x)C family [Bacillota bacterium]
MLNKINNKTAANIARQIIIAGISICICMFTTGCWDLKETQDRHFVLIAAIDDPDTVKESGSEKQPTAPHNSFPKHGTQDYMLSVQILKLVKPESKGGSIQSERTFVMSTLGTSMFDMVRDMLAQSSKSLYFEHLSAIVISEAAVKKHGIRTILDFFLRDPEMRWRTKIFITPGDAKAIAEFNPPTGEPGGPYLNGIIRNHKKNIHVAGSKTDVGFITRAIDNNLDYAIPRLEYIDNVPQLNGLALFKNNTLVSYADEYIIQGLKYILGTEKSAIISTNCPEHPNSEISYELFKHDTKLVPHIDGNNIYFTLDITMRGNIGEVNCPTSHNLHDSVFLHKIEQGIAQQVSKNVMDTWEFNQHLGLDLFNIKARLKGYHPFEWAKIKNRWEEIYSTIPLIVSVNVIIMGTGEHD